MIALIPIVGFVAWLFVVAIVYSHSRAAGLRHQTNRILTPRESEPQMHGRPRLGVMAEMGDEVEAQVFPSDRRAA